MTSDIDVGGVKPLVSRTEIHCGRPGNVRTNAGKPTYKSQEEQYQEIQELRRSLGELREENSSLKTRSRRLEEDLIRRDRQIEQLMDPAKNDEARRKLTDKGASLVSSLKLRVSRLEATLKEKEAELGKLQASTKATALNEMKIEAETYYQEVVRLRNQLNIVQQQQQQQQQFQHYQKPSQQSSPQHQTSPQHQSSSQHQSSPQHQHSQHLQPPSSQQEPKALSPNHWSNMRGGQDNREGMRYRRDGGDGQESPTTGLQHALSQLEEENARLGHQVSSLTVEKDRLEADLERVLGLSEDVKSNYEGVSRAELIREVERGNEEVHRWEVQHTQLTEALARRNDLAGDNSALLQARLAELQGREVEWERERSSLRELINTLKDDRMFYMETAQKKDSELESLRSEIQALQQEILALHDAQRKRNERPSGTMAQRSARGSGKQFSSSASRSGSSSDANTPTRRVRPSSARPPAPGTRPQRSPKSSSEPREIPPSNRTRKTPTQQIPKKSAPTKPLPKASSSTSSPSKGSAGSMQSSLHTTRLGSSNKKPATSSSASTPKASPYGSPKHSSMGRTSSSSTSSKAPTPVASPRKNAASVSPRRKPPGVSPQHRVTGSASPQPRSAGPASPAKPSTSRSSSRTSTPSSSAKSSPYKVNTQSKSPSKVPQPKIGASPSKRGKKREESASPARAPKASQKQETIRESSAFTIVAAAAPSRHARVSSLTASAAKADIQDNAYHTSTHITSRQQLYQSGDSQTCHKKEEDERVLAEILFQRETFSSGETSDAPPLARQRTMTLSVHEDVPSTNVEVENAEAEHVTGSNSLLRQNTVTLSRTDDDDDTLAQCSHKELRQDTINGREEESLCQEKNASDRVRQSTEVSSAGVSHQDSEIIENLELLQSLLSSHLSRQREVNELLNREPLLVGEGQSDSESQETPRRRGRSESQETPRGRGRSTREAPDGEESVRGPNKRSQSLVRQGTFNVYEQETAVATIHATLDAHLTRVNKVQQFSNK